MALRRTVATPILPTEQAAHRVGRADRWLMTAFALFTLIVGGVRATRHSFWVDEAASGIYSSRDFPGLLRALWVDAGKGPYYASLWVWARMGHSDWWLRMFSVLGAAAAVVGIYLVAHRVAGRAVAVGSAVVLLANPAFQSHWSEARDYPWMVATALASLLIAFRLRERPTWGWAAAGALVNGTLFALSPFTIVLLVVEWAWAATLWRERTTRALAAVWAAGSLVLITPFLHALLTTRSVDWIPEITAGRFRSGAASAVGGAWWWWALLVGNALLVLALFTRRVVGIEAARSRLLVAAAVIAAPALAVISLAKPSFVPRYLMWALAPTVVAAVAGSAATVRAMLTYSRSRAIPLAAGAAVLVFVGSLTFPYGRFGNYLREQDLRGAARVLERERQPSDRYLFLPYWTGQYVQYYADSPYPNVLRDTSAIDTAGPGKLWVLVFEDTPGLEEYLTDRGEVMNRTMLAGVTVYEVLIAPR